MKISLPLQSKLKSFLLEIENLGYELTLVGGALRDYLLNQKLSHDLDFEIRSIHHLDLNVLISFLKNKKINYEELSYQIIKFDYLSFNLEFGAPRLETHLDNNNSHHHFDATIGLTLAHNESFKRRDLTINAIGAICNFKTDEFLIVDPFSGVKDLEHKILRAVSDDFYLDYVRLLRVIRFKMLFGFEFSESLKKEMHRFDLRSVSCFHLRREAEKSKSVGLFFDLLFNIIEKFNILADEKILSFKKLVSLKDSKTSKDLFVNAFKENIGIDEISEIFLIPKKEKQELTSFYQSFIYLKKMTDSQVEKIKALAFKDLEDLSYLKELKNYFEKNQWCEFFESIFDKSQFDEIEVDNQTLMEFPNTKRSYYKTYLFIQKYL